MSAERVPSRPLRLAEHLTWLAGLIQGDLIDRRHPQAAVQWITLTEFIGSAADLALAHDLKASIGLSKAAEAAREIAAVRPFVPATPETLALIVQSLRLSAAILAQPPVGGPPLPPAPQGGRAVA